MVAVPVRLGGVKATPGVQAMLSVIVTVALDWLESTR